MLKTNEFKWNGPSIHSHYMINPLWLEKAYIVDNKAINYESSEDVDAFDIRKTDIEALKYRQFVGRHPNQTTYFQPVLDALEVGFSPLERSSRAIIVEGKFDFHPMLFLSRRVGPTDFQIFPANGAGDVGVLVDLFRGWGVEFRVIMDDDKAGREGRKRHIKDYLISEKDIVTIGDIAPKLAGQSFEAVYQKDVVEKAMDFFSVSSLSKRQYSLFFQELLLNKSADIFPDTEAAFKPIADWMAAAFKSKT